MKLLILLCLLSLSHVAQAGLTPSNISSFYGQRIYGVTPLADGETYARISDNGKRIIRYSFKTGEEIGTIFDADNTRDITINSLHGYILSPTEDRILIQTQTQGIYRHSFTAQYYIYDVATRRMTPLSTGGPQQIPTWSHDGHSIAFVRDNNIFLCKLLFGNAEV